LHDERAMRTPSRLPPPLLLSLSLLGITLSACGHGPGVPIQPLPELVMPQAPAAPITVRELLLVPQEQMLWDVHWKGLTIGRIELTVEAESVHSRFRTGAVVGTVTSIQHELDTVLDRAGAGAASQHELLTVDGDARTIDAAFDDAGFRIEGRPPPPAQAGRVHTLHSALGALRAWARPGARPGFLIVLLAGEPLRLEVGEPVPEQLQDRAALRIDGRIAGGASPAAVTLWLRAGEDRTPLRIELASDDTRVSAELLEP
jgi:Protein of unknown function (DUF3108)